MKRIKLVAATAAMALAAFGFAAPVVAAEGTEEVATEEVVEAQEGEEAEAAEDADAEEAEAADDVDAEAAEDAEDADAEDAEDGEGVDVDTIDDEECIVDPNLTFELLVLHVDAEKWAKYQELMKKEWTPEIAKEWDAAWDAAQLFKGGSKDEPYLDIQRNDLKDGDKYEAKARTFPGYKFKGAITEFGHDPISGTIEATAFSDPALDNGECIQQGGAFVVLAYEKEATLANTGAHGITTAGVIAAAMLAAGSGLVAVRRRRA